ncbi:MAG: tRNA pseudouridine(13) synthase TruD [Planctomycetota bacterium]|nr:MAG: tRNA pseudouridine(13) synthase TruD [Planctomycetota bacterium]
MSTLAGVPPELARAYATSAAGIPGEARREPEDFVVEEVPLYEPSGEGEHLYLLVEKRGITTEEAARRLARRLGVRRRDVGYAGRKDARAVTWQRISFFRARLPADLEALADERLRVHEARPHRNKLKLGHLRGNRFRIRLRGSGSSEDVAREVLDALAARGALNYFGLQRFGHLRNNHRLGAALARGDADAFLELLLLGSRASRGEPLPAAEPDSPLAAARELVLSGRHREAWEHFPQSMRPERAACRALAEGRSAEAAVRAVPVRQREFYLAAFQSLLFNAYLSRRKNLADRVEEGEVAFLHRNGAAFLVEDEAREQARGAAFEISPSGPLFGRRLLRPRKGSGPRADEEALLAEHAPGLGPELGAAFGTRPLGQRRPLRIPVRDVELRREGEDLRVGFFLPRGCYATTVLEELFKRPVA